MIPYGKAIGAAALVAMLAFISYKVNRAGYNECVVETQKERDAFKEEKRKLIEQYENRNDDIIDEHFVNEAVVETKIEYIEREIIKHVKVPNENDSVCTIDSDFAGLLLDLSKEVTGDSI